MRRALLLVVSLAGGAGLATYFGLRTGDSVRREAFLLIDARLVRVVRKVGRELSVRSQTVSRVRFLAREGEVTALFLPSGERGGVTISFVPRINDRNLELVKTWSCARLWPPGEFESYSTDSDRSGEPAELDRGSRYVSEQAQDVALAGIAIAVAGVEISYTPIVRCDGLFTADELVGRKGTLVELPNGEKLHELRCAAPYLMTTGAWCESPDWIRLK